jgi:hypothetical protein
VRYLRVLAHNAVPLAGVLFFEWPVFTLLALFWVDGFLRAVTDAVRIRAHPSHRTGPPDYSGRRFDWVAPPPPKGTYLGRHVRSALSMLAICGAGLLIAFSLIPGTFDVYDFAGGFAAAAVIAAIELASDLRTIGERSLLWLQHQTLSTPTSLLFVTLLVGIPIGIWFSTVTAAFVILVLLKTLADCGEVMWDEHKARLWPANW